MGSFFITFIEILGRPGVPGVCSGCFLDLYQAAVVIL